MSFLNDESNLPWPFGDGPPPYTDEQLDCARVKFSPRLPRVQPPSKMPVEPWDERSELRVEAEPSKKRARTVEETTEEPKSKKPRLVERMKLGGEKCMKAVVEPIERFIQRGEESDTAKKLLGLYASYPAFLFEDEAQSPPPPPPPTFNLREKVYRQVEEYCETVEGKNSPDHEEELEDGIFPEAPRFSDPASDKPEHYMSGALPTPDEPDFGGGFGFEYDDDETENDYTNYGDVFGEEYAYLARQHVKRPYHYWTIGKAGFEQWTLL